ncbi:putative alpha-mannosyltransferase, nucleotide-diphospho-sugar transferase [Plasmopara halstedii]
MQLQSQMSFLKTSSVQDGLLHPNSQKSSSGRIQHTMMFVFFVFVVLTCALGLICVASLIQQRDLQLQRLALRSLHGNEHDSVNQRVDSIDKVKYRSKAQSDFENFECVGWKAQRNCSSDGGPDPMNDRACNATVYNSESGFCEIRDKITGELHQVMKMHCNSLRSDVMFRCDEFATFLSYGRIAIEYVHDTTFSMKKCRKQLVEDQTCNSNDTIKTNLEVHNANRSDYLPGMAYERGIVVVVYENVLLSVYALVRSLRSLGCTLPVELWYKRSETDPMNPLLRDLTSRYGAYIREIRDPRAATYYTKTYAVFYSAFDQVLLLDADNFAVRNPTYLFDTSEFQTTGAIFWPDFWHFKKTIFNIQPTSFVWEVFDLQPVDMFEQESGQVLIDRKKHVKALNVLMYYAFHPHVFERLRLVWGDKDLFRFAWLKTASSFHMIETPPGAAGVKLPDQNIFCGVTMVQHDPKRGIVFLHRNQQKLSSNSRDKVWAHIQEFRMDEVNLEEYDIRGANGGRYFPNFKRCFGKDMDYEKAFTVQAIDKLPFANLEQQLLNFVHEAMSL